MKFRVTLSLLLLCLSIQVNAQQRKRTTSQHRVSTAVRKPVQSTITKTRKVGNDGFVWYELEKDGLYGAADIEGNTIIPIRYSWVFYNSYSLHYFEVHYNDFKGIYTRMGRCIIPIDKHFTKCEIKSHKRSDNEKLYLGVACMNNNGQMAFFDIHGNEVIPLGEYEDIRFSYSSRDKYIEYILYTQNGLSGAFDLNGKLLTPPCSNDKMLFIEKDNITIYNKTGKTEKYIQYHASKIYGSYSEDTRFDYNNYDRLYYPSTPISSSSSSSSTSSSPSSSSSSSSSSSNSSSSSSSSSHQQRQVWKERWRPCTACDPNRKGYCRYCHGQGGSYIGNIYNVCGICGGTGSCTMCGGRGEIKETYSTWE